MGDPAYLRRSVSESHHSPELMAKHTFCTECVRPGACTSAVYLGPILVLRSACLSIKGGGARARHIVLLGTINARQCLCQRSDDSEWQPLEHYDFGKESPARRVADRVVFMHE